MFSTLIPQTCNSERTGNNYITDGRFQAAYGELPAVFEKIDNYLILADVSSESFLAFRCSNNVFGAVFLLWALCRERKILLTPPSAGKGKEKGRHADAPHFCQHLVSIDFTP